MRRPRSHRFPGFARTQIPGLQVKQMGLSYCCCACLALCMDPSWDHPCRMARISRSSAMQGFRQGLQHQRTSGEEVRRIHSVSTGLDPSDSVNAPRILSDSVRQSCLSAYLHCSIVADDTQQGTTGL